MAQAVSQRSVAADARVRSQIIPCEICGVQSGNGTDLSPSTSFSPVSIITPMLRTYLHLHTQFTYQQMQYLLTWLKVLNLH